MKKKVIGVLLATAMAFGLAACGNSAGGEAVKQETLKKMMLFSSNGKGTLNQPSQDELVKAVVQEVLRELGRK